MIKRVSITILSLIFGLGVLSAQNEQIVYIDGVKYTVYIVMQGDTLYSLAKTYDVTVEAITAANPILSEGLKQGQTIKIPHDATLKKQKPAKRSKRQFLTHVVQKGETLYSISRQYEIAIDALIADNDNIDPSHISIGQTIYVRRNQMGLTSESESREQIEEHKQIMNSVAPDQYSYHVVHEGEDAANIATRFNTTVEQLLALNGFTAESNIREGLIIKVPKPVIIVATDSLTVELEHKPIERVRFAKLPVIEPANVALMLPMGKSGVPAQNFLDFYQGFLLGADHLRMKGYESHINLYNTAHDNEKVAQIIESETLKDANVIVGPVYEDTLIPVVKYAEKHNIPVVSPLANLMQSVGNNLFQMSPKLEAKYDKVKNLFDGSRRVVFITSDTIDKDFENEIKSVLGQTPYITHKYEYEHPSVIEKREKARLQGVEVPLSPSDLSPLLESGIESVFVILAGSEIEVDRILAALASANSSLTARSIKVAPYLVFGNNKWNRYKNIDRSLFFSNNVVMLSTYHIDRSDRHIRNFGSEYIKAFGTLPSLYAYRGYDAAIIFIGSLYDEIEDSLKDRRFIPLQTPYTFVENENSKVHVNSEWVKVNYNSNFTITAE